MFEWNKERRLSAHDFIFKDMRSSYYEDYIPVIEKLGFEPHKKVIYKCAYGSNMPSLKYVFGLEVDRHMDVLTFFQCVHIFQFKFVTSHKEFTSQLHPTPFYFMQQEFFLALF